MARGRRRQRVEWYRVNAVIGGTGAILNTVVIPNTEIREMTSPTLVRTRGNLMAYSDTIDTANVITLGLIVMTESSAAAIPTPLGDPDADWFYYEGMPSINTTASTGRYWRQPVDNRAKRKLNEDELVMLVVEAVAADINVLYSLSFLLRQV